MKWIIGDCHGCYNTLIYLLQKLPNNAEPKDIVFVGDLIDRGPDSRKIINFVRDGGYTCLQGNHEQLMIEAFDDYKLYNEPLNYQNGWILNGGLITLSNYLDNGEVDFISLEKDVEWMRNLPTIKIFPETDNNDRKLIITHAVSVSFIDRFFYLSNKYSEIEYDELDIETAHQLTNMGQLIVWNRSIPNVGSDNFFNVSGHNIIENFIHNRDGELIIDKKYLVNDIIINDDLGYACIDTGVFIKTLKENTGKITCLEFPSMKVYQQKNIEKD